MRHPFAFVAVLSQALLLLGGTSWADEELEYASNGVYGGVDDFGAGDPRASPQQPGQQKRNLAALARGGRLPRFHYHKKLGPAATAAVTAAAARGRLFPGRTASSPQLSQLKHQLDQQPEDGWMADRAFQGDAPERMGVVGALGRLSEAAIFPYIGPHRYSLLHSTRLRRAVVDTAQQQQNEKSGQRLQPELKRQKRNVAALARNGWLPRGASARGTRADFLRPFSISQTEEPSTYEDFGDEETFEDCNDDDSRSVQDELVFGPPEEAKRNLAHLARMGRLPPFHYRRVWSNDESPATSPWPQARPKRQAKRCRTNGSKRNVAAMARKGALPRS